MHIIFLHLIMNRSIIKRHYHFKLSDMKTNNLQIAFSNTTLSSSITNIDKNSNTFFHRLFDVQNNDDNCFQLKIRFYSI